MLTSESNRKSLYKNKKITTQIHVQLAFDIYDVVLMTFFKLFF